MSNENQNKKAAEKAKEVEEKLKDKKEEKGSTDRKSVV